MNMTDLTRENQAPQGATQEASEFASLLMQEFKPKTERAREAVETAVRTLAEQAWRRPIWSPTMRSSRSNRSLPPSTPSSPRK
jgi:predicted component of type VI protein secretion system